MKILAISCSPSRGRNSDTMLDNFILGMKEIPDIEIEKIYLEDIPIDTYKYENSKGPGKHEQKLKELAEKIPPQNTEVSCVKVIAGPALTTTCTVVIVELHP